MSEQRGFSPYEPDTVYYYKDGEVISYEGTIESDNKLGTYVTIYKVKEGIQKKGTILFAPGHDEALGSEQKRPDKNGSGYDKNVVKQMLEDGYDVIAFKSPDDVNEAVQRQELGRLLAHAIDEQNDDEVYIVGHSYGGFLMEYMIENEELDVDPAKTNLILMSSPTSGQDTVRGGWAVTNIGVVRHFYAHYVQSRMSARDGKQEYDPKSHRKRLEFMHATTSIVGEILRKLEAEGRLMRILGVNEGDQNDGVVSRSPERKYISYSELELTKLDYYANNKGYEGDQNNGPEAHNFVPFVADIIAAYRSNRSRKTT